MVELRAAPPAPIRYTTDGSDPKLLGGRYDDPFAAPNGTRLVLAVAEHDGIVSELHKREITWHKDEGDKPVDKAMPATWRSTDVSPSSGTRNSYGFIERLRKHAGRAGVQRIGVLVDDHKWAEFNLADGMALDADQIERTVEQLRALIEVGEISIEASFIAFATGQNLLDYIQELRVELRRGEVEQ